MQWIKSVGSAVSYLSQSSNCPYQLSEGKKLEGCCVPWTVHSSKKKDGSQPVTVFVYEVTASSPPSEVTAAKNCLKRLRTLRHPQVLLFLDGGEPDKATGKIWIVTEAVIPLREELTTNPATIAANELTVSWGLYSVFKGTAFLNNDCHLVHGSLGVGAIFVTKSGDWKIGGFDLLSDMNDQDCALRVCESIRQTTLLPPEMARGGQWPLLQAQPTHSIDSWSLGVFIHEIFNGKLFSMEDLRNPGKIPATLVQTFRSFLSSNADKRVNPSSALDCPFCSTELVRVNCFLEEIAVKDVASKEMFCKRLFETMDALPDSMCRHKLLPELVKVLEFGGIASAVLGPLLKIGRKLSAEEFTAEIVPSVVRCFASQDRAMRIGLLQNLETFAAHLTPDLIEKDIFPHVCSGFQDTAPLMREATVKSMIHLAPKLSEKAISGTLLRHFSQLQMDSEPSIRTNTTICLGKVAPSMPDALRKKVLIPALTRSLKDPFPPSRGCALVALAATMEMHDPTDVAHTLIPALGPFTVDPDLEVRTQAVKCLRAAALRVESCWDEIFKDEFAAVAGANNASSSATSAAVGGSWIMGIASTALKTTTTSAPSPSNNNATPAPTSSANSTPTHKANNPTPSAASSSQQRPATSNAAAPAASSNNSALDDWGFGQSASAVTKKTPVVDDDGDDWEPLEKTSKPIMNTLSTKPASRPTPTSSAASSAAAAAGGVHHPMKLGAVKKDAPSIVPAANPKPATTTVTAKSGGAAAGGTCDDLLDLLNDDWGASPPAGAQQQQQPAAAKPAAAAAKPSISSAPAPAASVPAIKPAPKPAPRPVVAAPPANKAGRARGERMNKR